MIYAYMILRTLSCIALFGLSIGTLSSRSNQSQLPVFGASVSKFSETATYVSASSNGCLMNLKFLQFYISLLAVGSVSTGWRLTRTLSRHISTVLFVTFAVYFYRDVIPLATVDWPIQDVVEGRLLWAKVSLLTLAAVIIPLVMPRMYIPVDPKVLDF